MLILSSFNNKTDAVSTQFQPDTSRLGIEAHKWYLSAIHKEGEVKQVTNKKAFINFNIGKGSAGGNGSCNSFGSTVTLDGSKMGFKNIFSTKMYCEGVQPIENDFFEQLAKVTRYSIREGKLLLFKEDSLLLEFEP